MALEGNLLDMSLVDLFQIFRMGPKTGVLELCTDADCGTVYVGEGRLLDAMLIRRPNDQVLAAGEEAVLQMLQWEQANFVFCHDKTVLKRPVQIVHDSEWLILEGMRRRKNPLTALTHQPISMETSLALALQPSSVESGVNLDLDQWRILSQVAISSNLGEICEKIAMPPDKAIRTVSELVAIGLLEVLYMPALALGGEASAERMVTDIQPEAHQALSNGHATSNAPARGLLRAIMRRVRGI
jgi:hypothetical protein